MLERCARNRAGHLGPVGCERRDVRGGGRHGRFVAIVDERVERFARCLLRREPAAKRTPIGGGFNRVIERPQRVIRGAI